MKTLKIQATLSGAAIVAIAGYLWHQTTTIPTLDPSLGLRSETNWGKQSCDNFNRVRLKISMSKQRETALLNAEDINTLFACRLYVGLGEQPDSIVQTKVRFSRKAWSGSKDMNMIRAEATVDLAKVPTAIKDYRLESYGPTALSTIIFKLCKIPVLGSQKLFFAVEGNPTIRERNFIFYDQPQVQIGQWQFTFNQVIRFLKIYPPFIQESLEKEYGSLPMEPHSIFVVRKTLELQLNGSKTAW